MMRVDKHCCQLEKEDNSTDNQFFKSYVGTTTTLKTFTIESSNKLLTEINNENDPDYSHSQLFTDRLLSSDENVKRDNYATLSLLHKRKLRINSPSFQPVMPKWPTTKFFSFLVIFLTLMYSRSLHVNSLNISDIKVLGITTNNGTRILKISDITQRLKGSQTQPGAVAPTTTIEQGGSAHNVTLAETGSGPVIGLVPLVGPVTMTSSGIVNLTHQQTDLIDDGVITQPPFPLTTETGPVVVGVVVPLGLTLPPILQSPNVTQVDIILGGEESLISTTEATVIGVSENEATSSTTVMEELFSDGGVSHVADEGRSTVGHDKFGPSSVLLAGAAGVVSVGTAIHGNVTEGQGATTVVTFVETTPAGESSPFVSKSGEEEGQGFFEEGGTGSTTLTVTTGDGEVASKETPTLLETTNLTELSMGGTTEAPFSSESIESDESESAVTVESTDTVTTSPIISTLQAESSPIITVQTTDRPVYLVGAAGGYPQPPLPGEDSSLTSTLLPSSVSYVPSSPAPQDTTSPVTWSGIMTHSIEQQTQTLVEEGQRTVLAIPTNDSSHVGSSNILAGAAAGVAAVGGAFAVLHVGSGNQTDDKFTTTPPADSNFFDQETTSTAEIISAHTSDPLSYQEEGVGHSAGATSTLPSVIIDKLQDTLLPDDGLTTYPSEAPPTDTFITGGDDMTTSMTQSEHHGADVVALGAAAAAEAVAGVGAVAIHDNTTESQEITTMKDDLSSTDVPPEEVLTTILPAVISIITDQTVVGQTHPQSTILPPVILTDGEVVEVSSSATATGEEDATAIVVDTSTYNNENQSSGGASAVKAALAGIAAAAGAAGIANRLRDGGDTYGVTPIVVVTEQQSYSSDAGGETIKDRLQFYNSHGEEPEDVIHEANKNMAIGNSAGTVMPIQPNDNLNYPTQSLEELGNTTTLKYDVQNIMNLINNQPDGSPVTSGSNRLLTFGGLASAAQLLTTKSKIPYEDDDFGFDNDEEEEEDDGNEASKTTVQLKINPITDVGKEFSTSTDDSFEYSSSTVPQAQTTAWTLSTSTLKDMIKDWLTNYLTTPTSRDDDKNFSSVGSSLGTDNNDVSSPSWTTAETNFYETTRDHHPNPNKQKEALVSGILNILMTTGTGDNMIGTTTTSSPYKLEDNEMKGDDLEVKTNRLTTLIEDYLSTEKRRGVQESVTELDDFKELMNEITTIMVHSRKSTETTSTYTTSTNHKTPTSSTTITTPNDVFEDEDEEENDQKGINDRGEREGREFEQIEDPPELKTHETVSISEEITTEDSSRNLTTLMDEHLKKWDLSFNKSGRLHDDNGEDIFELSDLTTAINNFLANNLSTLINEPSSTSSSLREDYENLSTTLKELMYNYLNSTTVYGEEGKTGTLTATPSLTDWTSYHDDALSHLTTTVIDIINGGGGDWSQDVISTDVPLKPETAAGSTQARLETLMTRFMGGESYTNGLFLSTPDPEILESFTALTTTLRNILGLSSGTKDSSASWATSSGINFTSFDENLVAKAMKEFLAVTAASTAFVKRYKPFTSNKEDLAILPDDNMLSTPAYQKHESFEKITQTVVDILASNTDGHRTTQPLNEEQELGSTTTVVVSKRRQDENEFEEEDDDDDDGGGGTEDSEAKHLSRGVDERKSSEDDLQQGLDNDNHHFPQAEEMTLTTTNPRWTVTQSTMSYSSKSSAMISSAVTIIADASIPSTTFDGTTMTTDDFEQQTLSTTISPAPFTTRERSKFRTFSVKSNDDQPNSLDEKVKLTSNDKANNLEIDSKEENVEPVLTAADNLTVEAMAEASEKRGEGEQSAKYVIVVIVSMSIVALVVAAILYGLVNRNRNKTFKSQEIIEKNFPPPHTNNGIGGGMLWGSMANGKKSGGTSIFSRHNGRHPRENGSTALDDGMQAGNYYYYYPYVVDLSAQQLRNQTKNNSNQQQAGGTRNGNVIRSSMNGKPPHPLNNQVTHHPPGKISAEKLSDPSSSFENINLNDIVLNGPSELTPESGSSLKDRRYYDYAHMNVNNNNSNGSMGSNDPRPLIIATSLTSGNKFRGTGLNGVTPGAFSPCYIKKGSSIGNSKMETTCDDHDLTSQGSLQSTTQRCDFKDVSIVEDSRVTVVDMTCSEVNDREFIKTTDEMSDVATSDDNLNSIVIIENGKLNSQDSPRASYIKFPPSPSSSSTSSKSRNIIAK